MARGRGDEGVLDVLDPGARLHQVVHHLRADLLELLVELGLLEVGKDRRPSAAGERRAEGPGEESSERSPHRSVGTRGSPRARLPSISSTVLRSARVRSWVRGWELARSLSRLTVPATVVHTVGSDGSG